MNEYSTWLMVGVIIFVIGFAVGIGTILVFQSQGSVSQIELQLQGVIVRVKPANVYFLYTVKINSSLAVQLYDQRMYQRFDVGDIVNVSEWSTQYNWYFDGQLVSVGENITRDGY